MTYQPPQIAPVSSLAPERRGLAVARFCKSCQEFFPAHRGRHRGKPLYGKDHVASTCAHEGEAFEDGAAWWEAAVEVLAAAPAAVPAA
jgi:hypothetical protein